MSTVISVENVSKAYRLGVIGGGTLRDDLQRLWARTRGKPDPLLKIGEKDHGNRDGEMVWALRDVSFQVKQGEVLGIIGRNGAGKSTLLKILSQVTAPTTGQIKVKGRNASLLEVGTGFHPELTGRENIFLNGAILGMGKAEIGRKLDDIIAFAEVERFIETPVKRYSSGMYVRLAFAVAAHLDPEILIVDEVLAVGDAAFQRKCLEKIGDVARGGRTVLFVSHNMGAVKAFCTAGLCLDRGQVALVGDAAHCVERYLGAGYAGTGPHANIERVPEAPVQLLSVSVVDHQGRLATTHQIDRPFYIRVSLAVRAPVRGVYTAAHIHDSTDTVLFTRDFDADEGRLLTREPGSYSYEIRVPERLLVPGPYRISVHVAHSAPTKLIMGADYVCPFEIVDAGTTCAKFGFPWRGKIALPLPWVCIGHIPLGAVDAQVPEADCRLADGQLHSRSDEGLEG